MCVCVTCGGQIKLVQKASGLFFSESLALFSSALLCNGASEQDEDLSLFVYSHMTMSHHLCVAAVNYS